MRLIIPQKLINEARKRESDRDIKRETISVVGFQYCLKNDKLNPDVEYILVNQKEKKILGAFRVVEAPKKLVAETTYTKGGINEKQS